MLKGEKRFVKERRKEKTKQMRIAATADTKQNIRGKSYFGLFKTVSSMRSNKRERWAYCWNADKCRVMRTVMKNRLENM